MKKYKVFKWDDKNTGFYIRQSIPLGKARRIAKEFAMATVEGENGFFEKYELGEKVEWSA